MLGHALFPIEKFFVVTKNETYGNRHFWCRGYYADTVGNSNAIKYNHFHGTVNVHCEELSDDGNMAVFQFVCSDTGLGMSEEFQKHEIGRAHV